MKYAADASLELTLGASPSIQETKPAQPQTGTGASKILQYLLTQRRRTGDKPL